MMRHNNPFEPRIPLFFKLGFAFVALFALSIIGTAVYVLIAVGSDPAILGRIAGEIMSGFREVSP
jgi:hypothetical protein